MSYRELRNFAELMRALGYQRLVSVENFRKPNFELVASALYWMVKRYDPEINVSDCIEKEDDRVDFLTTAAKELATKAKIKLNTKRLYAADGRAVKELLKVATMLYSASQANESAKNEDPSREVAPLNSRIKDIKVARTLATEITDKGARLYDLLGHEKDVKTDRQRALNFLDTISSNLDSTAEHHHIKKSVDELVANVAEDIEQTKKQNDELGADERGLDAKIKKKQSELERHEKRLKSLQTVRPAFMDEYEKLERELQRQYGVYLERFRNLDYLQNELEMYNKSEKEKLDENDRSLKRMQKRLREEELRILRGEQDLNDTNVDKALGDKGPGPGKSSDRNGGPDRGGGARAAGGGGAGASRSRHNRGGRDRDGRVQGSMVGNHDDGSESEDIDSDDISHDSESDSVSLAPSSNGGSEIDEIEDDDEEGSEMSEEDGEESHYASGQSSNEF